MVSGTDPGHLYSQGGRSSIKQATSNMSDVACLLLCVLFDWAGLKVFMPGIKECGHDYRYAAEQYAHKL